MTTPVTEVRATFVERPGGRFVVLTLDDGTGEGRPCTLSAATMDSLEGALDGVESDPSVAGVLLTGKPSSFCAGAELDAFVGQDRTAALGASRRGHAVFARLEALEVPTLAAVNGICMGGGLELALHCDVRTVSTAARALAFPEVALSIVPGWGGTQLAPRLVGARGAVRAIVLDPLAHNRTMTPADALDRGFVDRLIDAAAFVDDSLALLERIVAGDEHIERHAATADGLDDALAEGWAAAEARTHGATPAPYRALDLIGHAARGGDLAEGRRLEQEALADLVSSRQGQAAIYSFDLLHRRARRQTGRPDVPGREIHRVGIVGAGRMGAQLGALHLTRLQVPVVMVDTDAGVLERCREVIDGQLARAAERGQIDADRARELAGLVTTSTDPAALAGADWVMEAVAEDLEVKRTVLAQIEQQVEADSVLATNTSSLSVRAMAQALDRPERLVGLHFFNPVAVLPLVEVVRPADAADVALARAFDVAAALGKTAVACADAPGFVVNRLLFRFHLAADVALARAFDVAAGLGKTAVACADAPGFVVNRLLFRFHLAAAAGVADGTPLPAIDEAIRRLGVPMGPFELFDLVGLGVTLHVAESLAAALGPRFVVDDNLRAICAGEPRRIHDDGVVDARILERLTIRVDGVAWDAGTVQRAAMEAAADEAGRMLDERVVDDPRDLDIAMLLGAGWPSFNGGICHWLDHTGVSERVLGRRLLG